MLPLEPLWAPVPGLVHNDLTFFLTTHSECSRCFSLILLFSYFHEPRNRYLTRSRHAFGSTEWRRRVELRQQQHNDGGADVPQVHEDVVQSTGARAYRFVVGEWGFFFLQKQHHCCLPFSIKKIIVFYGTDNCVCVCVCLQISDDTCTGSDGQGRNGSGQTRSGNRRKRKSSGKDKNVRRLESNERERLRMHSINDAFQVTL